MLKRNLAITTVLTFVLVGLLGAAPAYSDPLDLNLSWSADANVDTLVVAEPGTYDCYLRLGPDLSPVRFAWFWSHLLMTPGVTVEGVEGLLGPSGIVSLHEDGSSETGSAVTVSIDYADCLPPYEGTLTFAKLTVTIDPSALPPDGTGLIWPMYMEDVPQSTMLGIRDTLCLGYVTPWPCTIAVVRNAAVPNENMSFGDLKALYR